VLRSATDLMLDAMREYDEGTRDMRTRKRYERSDDHSTAGEVPAKRTPTVYFIDDSATMREVIKIAFRRENINVITCADAASALAQFEQNRQTS